MSEALPLPRKVPVVPRPRHGELSGSYVARVAHANRTKWSTFARLIGQPSGNLPSDPDELASTILSVNHAAYARLLAYTGLDSVRLMRAIPSLTPTGSAETGEPPAIRASSLRYGLTDGLIDCPECVLRRDGAFLDTRLFPLQMACLRHGYWLHREGAGDRLNPAILPEIETAQRRLLRAARRSSTKTVVRAYGIARTSLCDRSRPLTSPAWRYEMMQRWRKRAEAMPSPSAPKSLSENPWPPGWAMHPECAALAAVLASPYWAERAVPTLDKQHKLFYQHILTVLGLDDERTRPGLSMTDFGPLADEIHDQARWGRILTNEDYGAPYPDGVGPRRIPYIDITDDGSVKRRFVLMHSLCD
jgi:hypothetical protein